MKQMEEAPLKDVRVLSISQYGAGPFGTLYLADLGAEIIKIENSESGGDVSRYIPPYAEDQDSLFFQALNRNKKSISIDLKTEEGQLLFRRLVKKVDIVFNNLRGDVPEKLGLLYDQLKDVNPAIVCTSLSGFGLTGPRRADPGYDYLIQGLSGLMSLTGDPDGPPTRAGFSVIDFTGGITAALGSISAVMRARRTGIGGDVDVSLMDSGLTMLSYLVPWSLTGEYEPIRLPDSAHPSVVPSQVFPTADGYIVVMCQKEKFWISLCKIMDRNDLIQDTRFSTMLARYKHREELIPILKEEFRRRTSADWIDSLRGVVPSAPINTVKQALAEPHVAAREMLIKINHPKWGEVKVVNSPIKISQWRTPTNPAPNMGEDTSDVLKTLLNEDIEDLNKTSIINNQKRIEGDND